METAFTQKIEITNKTGINTTISIATLRLISYVAAISRIKSCFLSHELLKIGADDDASVYAKLGAVGILISEKLDMLMI